jgi:ATP-binding protein involved in chromosome partitioning
MVVTTPQIAAAEVAQRAGSIALQTNQRLVGVLENMSWLELPSGERMEIFGSGGGHAVAQSLTRLVGAPVPLLGQIPLDPRVRESGDQGTPIVLSDPQSPAAAAIIAVAKGLAVRRESLVGRPLGLRPATR